MSAITTYYHHAAMNEWYMVNADGSGKGLRFQSGQLVYNANQYFTFDTNEHDFITEGWAGGQFEKIERSEYLEALSLYLEWVQKALLGVNGELEKVAA